MPTIKAYLPETIRQLEQVFAIARKATPRKTCKRCQIERGSQEFDIDERAHDLLAKVCNVCKSQEEAAKAAARIRVKPAKVNKYGNLATPVAPPFAPVIELWEASEPTFSPNKNRRIFSDAQKRLKWFEQGGKCAYCQVDLSITGFHADHIHPFIKGGSNTTSNLALACPKCNARKKDAILHEHWKPLNPLQHTRRECIDHETGFRWECE